MVEVETAHGPATERHPFPHQLPQRQVYVTSKENRKEASHCCGIYKEQTLNLNIYLAEEFNKTDSVRRLGWRTEGYY